MGKAAAGDWQKIATGFQGKGSNLGKFEIRISKSETNRQLIKNPNRSTNPKFKTISNHGKQHKFSTPATPKIGALDFDFSLFRISGFGFRN
jgi:hypothetical protein